MKNEITISEAEIEVMKVLWRLKEATSSEIIGALTTQTEWKPKTIQTMITRLATKGAIQSKKLTEKTFKYFPCISEEDYRHEANESFLKKVYDGSIKRMMVHFIKDNKLSKEDIEELKQILEEQER